MPPGARQLETDAALQEAFETMGGDVEPLASSGMGLLNSYAAVFVAAFVVTLLATPLVRRLALRANLTDCPDGGRKLHGYPVAYLGGVAVFLGLIVAIGVSYFLVDGVAALYRSVPNSVVIGLVVITFTGLADDVWGWDPRLKIAGQLVAAAALAIQDVGVKVAAGMLRPVASWLGPLLGNEDLIFMIPAPGGDIPIDLIYWAGTAIIAMFVLGGCNAANLLDGLDGLLAGVVAVVAIGLLCISVLMALHPPMGSEIGDEGLAGARVVLCLALLGVSLGFLPHNFNPATIFLGDCGSHLLGYVSVVIILMFGEFGQTHLVFAGLIIFAVPIIDTMLAIIRRWLAGKPMSVGDDQHVHHQLNRALSSVKRAVFVMYGISAAFAVVGVTLAGLVMFTQLRVRIVYAVALLLFGFIGVIAVKTVSRERALQGKIAVSDQPSAVKDRRSAVRGERSAASGQLPADS